MPIDYVTCDVFTHAPFGGNPLAVVLDAQGLRDDEMQAIAREFNYSETTFVLPPQNPSHAARVRIFTPVAELPFAGHPNVGTAVVLAQLGRLGDAEDVVFEEKAGLVPMHITRDGARVVGATLTAPVAPQLGAEVAASEIAQALGLPTAAVSTRRHPPRLASAGVFFLIAELADLQALGAAQMPPSSFMSESESTGLFLYAATAGEADFRARMFAPGHGVPEDPATGSAVAALAGLLGLLAEGEGTYAWTIDQGVEMGRPSRLNATATRDHGGVHKITVGGGAVVMMHGRITGLPA
ncbi:MAG: PhzF family phenazine biosynthesis protein [Pseudomonadota bacterium]